METNLKCPKCKGELIDRYDSSIWCKVKKTDLDRFECIGHLIKPMPYPFISQYAMRNRTSSCGYFGLETLGVEYQE
ncbi:hypothetical protein BKG88_09080 [Rodentibacter ratti]|uniref:Uncharacterized protein n=1 Tax=Rodentibacter ratti TaxID=1906745 RepID=A0A1V3L6E1_9PAST|nr:hypothetical protein BKG88_09080 [Rodentibacter ratti]